MIEDTRGSGANSAMSEAWPNITTPLSCRAAMAAVEVGVLHDHVGTLFKERVGRVGLFSPDRTRVFTQMILICMSGFTALAARYAALMPRTTSGIGKGGDVAHGVRLGHVPGDMADHPPRPS